VAEDNVVNQMVIRALLESAGIHVVVVDNGRECLERITSIQPDIVLMDCQMPVCDGYTATSRLRAAGWTLPIIAVTASAAGEVKERCLAAGMSGFLAKPVSRAGLLQLISEHAPHA
jgi:CheY-like chemotaxis protein